MNKKPYKNFLFSNIESGCSEFLLLFPNNFISKCEQKNMKKKSIQTLFPSSNIESGYLEFLGIPYALPPLGEVRFMPAHPLTSLDMCWNGTLDAKTYKRCWMYDQQVQFFYFFYQQVNFFEIIPL